MPRIIHIRADYLQIGDVIGLLSNGSRFCAYVEALSICEQYGNVRIEYKGLFCEFATKGVKQFAPDHIVQIYSKE